MAVVKKDRGGWVTGDLTVLDDLTVNSDVTLTGDIVISGDFAIGESGDGSDLVAYGDTAGYSFTWDADQDTNGGATIVGTTVLTGNLTVDGTLVSLDGATSVRGISAGFVSLESPANRFGVNATEYMQIATTATTGATAITHTGSGPAVTWAATSLAFTGNFSTDGATNVLDGSTSVRNVSAGFVSLESPANRFGANATEYMQVATTATTGATAITHTGSGPTVTWAATSLAFTGNFSSDGATAVLDGSTSVRGISAGFVSLESPANRFGANATEYMSIATTATTGATAITHTGSGPAVTWAADSLAFTGNFSTDGATNVLDGSTSVRGVSAGFTSLESPANRLGVNATIYMQVATTDTTGITAITHTGSAPTVTWTANSFDFVGALAADAVTLSDVLTFSDGGTIDNTAADTLTITETNIALTGGVTSYSNPVVLNHRHRVTVAEINAGHEILPAITGKSYRIIGVKAIAYGGAVGTTTTVDVLGTQSAAGVKLAAYAQASLTRSTVLEMGAAGAAVLADGASFVACDAATAVTVGKTGGDADTATGVDFIIDYVIE